MNTATHTRGPWRKVRLSKSWGIYDENGTCIAKVGEAFGVASERREADARLIENAPEMAMALDLVRMSHGWSYMSDETRALLKAVMSNIKGETQT